VLIVDLGVGKAIHDEPELLVELAVGNGRLKTPLDRAQQVLAHRGGVVETWVVSAFTLKRFEARKPYPKDVPQEGSLLAAILIAHLLKKAELGERWRVPRILDEALQSTLKKTLNFIRRI
jgi:hypothetical protein